MSRLLGRTDLAGPHVQAAVNRHGANNGKSNTSPEKSTTKRFSSTKRNDINATIFFPFKNYKCVMICFTDLKVTSLPAVTVPGKLKCLMEYFLCSTTSKYTVLLSSFTD